MIGAFSSLKSLIKGSRVSIDNGVFLLHYKFTVLALLVCTMMISCKQHFGEPITCLADNSDVKFGRATDAYCWVHETYTVNELIDGKAGRRSPQLAPGVGPHTNSTSKKIHRYYPWIGFFLLFQAWMFYFPRLLWKLWESGKMERLTLNLQNELNFREKELIARRKSVANYLLRNFHRQNYYAVKYITCELLNLLNVGAQIILTDTLLGHEFSSYGKDVINYVYEGMTDRTDPMDKVFPKLSKCTFNQFGPSGNIVPYDVLCVLTLNILHEKVFFFLWFWFLLLAVFSLLGVTYRISTILLPPIRRYRLETKASLCEDVEIKTILRYSHFADWLVITQLSKNMDPLIYADLLKDIAYKLKKNGKQAIRHQYSVSTLNELNRLGSCATMKHEINANSEPLYDCVPMELI
ncbi:innexin inx2 [Folsomia candida]|uniref:innexin inx2 n=1 Tax=Folsomia candida TaxID=158441 RepID=UPI000B90366C|nr:innexin inx2 [Folsomia candida]